MTEKSLRTSTSREAMCWYWKFYQPDELFTGWMVVCFPSNAVYVRVLTKTERVLAAYNGDQDCAWYGAYNQFTYALMVVSDSLEALCHSVIGHGFVPMLAH
jgi:hypothetical protein